MDNFLIADDGVVSKSGDLLPVAEMITLESPYSWTRLGGTCVMMARWMDLTWWAHVTGQGAT